MALSEIGRQHVSRAVLLTRRMRRAALLGDTESAQQQPLRDAEALGVPTVRFVLDPTDSERDDHLVQVLTELSERYEGFLPYAHSARDAEETLPIATSLETAREFITDMRHSFSWLERRFEGRNRIPLQDLHYFTSEIGIIAPLSTDFLYALLVSEFLVGKTLDGKLDVKPAATAHLPSEVVLPLDESGQQIFRRKSKIGIFLDQISGRVTINNLSPAVRRAYPGKTVYHWSR